MNPKQLPSHFKNASSVNLVIGRNGSGKSRLLRQLDETLSSKPAEYRSRYISPERGGTFKRDGSVLTNMESSKDYLPISRRKNQDAQFKQASAQVLNDLELAFLRRMESDTKLRHDPLHSFNSQCLDDINRVLYNLEVVRSGSQILFRTYNGDTVTSDKISSGESETITLCTEFMYFMETFETGKLNVLIIDEPDVHMHPDLQSRFAQLIVRWMSNLDLGVRTQTSIILATHSTSLIASLSACDMTSIGVKVPGVEEVNFVKIDGTLTTTLPLLGHSVSQIVSAEPLFIVEGEDDERVIQQAMRSSKGRFRVFPVISGTVDRQNELERECNRILSAIYDQANAYSLRDGDGLPDEITNEGLVIRFRLKCYAVENLLLTDEVLESANLTWSGFSERLAKWSTDNIHRAEADIVGAIASSSDRFRNMKIKSVRNIISMLIHPTRPWEVVVGQTLGKISEVKIPGEFSLHSYLGDKLCRFLLGDKTI